MAFSRWWCQGTFARQPWLHDVINKYKNAFSLPSYNKAAVGKASLRLHTIPRVIHRHATGKRSFTFVHKLPRVTIIKKRSSYQNGTELQTCLLAKATSISNKIARVRFLIEQALRCWKANNAWSYCWTFYGEKKDLVNNFLHHARNVLFLCRNFLPAIQM